MGQDLISHEQLIKLSKQFYVIATLIMAPNSFPDTV